MEPIAYLQSARDAYVERYRSALRAKREEGAQCTAEVWLEPNIPPGQPKPPHPICVDILVQADDRPSMIMVANDIAEGPLVGQMRIGGASVKVYTLEWESLPVWLRHPEPDWAALDPWRKKWMNVDQAGDANDDGLTGVVHYLGRPIVEGGGFLYEMDFGSAPVEAMTELLDVLAGMGASEIELGRSDGSDLPADVQAQLRRPDLSMAQLTDLVMRLFSALSEIDRVEKVNDEQISVRWKGDGKTGQVFLRNLHQLLQRTGVEARAREVYRYMRGQREWIAPEASPDLSQLRLVVKDDRFFENIRQHAPKMKPLVSQKLAADLWIVCVWDAPNGMRFTTEDEPEKYGLSTTQVLERAKANYLKERPPVEVSKDGSLLVAQTRDCYDATLLVDDVWCTEIAAKVKGDLLACAPARNMVLVGGAGRAETVPEIRRAAQRVEAGGDHLITSTILVRRQGRWQEYREIAPPPAPAPTPNVVKPKRRWRPFS